MLMMSTMTQINSHAGFAARIKRVRHSHAKMAQGYDARVGRDGLIVFRPKRRRRSIAWRPLMLLIAAFIGFKVFVLIQIGDITYQERVDRLAAGSVVEQAGAYFMQIDPVTRAVAAQVGPLL